MGKCFSYIDYYCLSSIHHTFSQNRNWLTIDYDIFTAAKDYQKSHFKNRIVAIFSVSTQTQPYSQSPSHPLLVLIPGRFVLGEGAFKQKVIFQTYPIRLVSLPSIISVGSRSIWVSKVCWEKHKAVFKMVMNLIQVNGLININYY